MASKAGAIPLLSALQFVWSHLPTLMVSAVLPPLPFSYSGQDWQRLLMEVIWDKNLGTKFDLKGTERTIRIMPLQTSIIFPQEKGRGLVRVPPDDDCGQKKAQTRKEKEEVYDDLSLRYRCSCHLSFAYFALEIKLSVIASEKRAGGVWRDQGVRWLVQARL